MLPARGVIAITPALHQNAPDGVAEWIRTEVGARAVGGVVIVPSGTTDALAKLSNRVTCFDGAIEAMGKSLFGKASKPFPRVVGSRVGQGNL